MKEETVSHTHTHTHTYTHTLFLHTSAARLRAVSCNYHSYRPLRTEEIGGGLGWLLHWGPEILLSPHSCHYSSLTSPGLLCFSQSAHNYSICPAIFHFVPMRSYCSVTEGDAALCVVHTDTHGEAPRGGSLAWGRSCQSNKLV